MINFHKVLISTAIVFCLVFAAWAWIAHRASGSAWTLVASIAFAVAALALAIYLSQLKRFLGR